MDIKHQELWDAYVDPTAPSVVLQSQSKLASKVTKALSNAGISNLRRNNNNNNNNNSNSNSGTGGSVQGKHTTDGGGKKKNLFTSKAKAVMGILRFTGGNQKEEK